MRSATTAAQILVRTCGLIQLTLGVLFLTGNGSALVPTQILAGTVLVLALFALAIMGAVAGVAAGRVAMALAWGSLTLTLGFTQTELLPGSFHWLVQVLHLLVSIAAIVQAEALAAQILRRQPQPARG
jgi:hypothetical protein